MPRKSAFEVGQMDLHLYWSYSDPAVTTQLYSVLFMDCPTKF